MLASKLSSSVGNNSASANYIEDVFSTYLYTGNGATQTITNGIDLAGKGGLVWTKSRGGTVGDFSHYQIDTVRGPGYYLNSNLTDAQTYDARYITSFNSDGYTFGSTPSQISYSGSTYASWTFRKQPKFFDVVTYTGNGVAGRTVAHSLGSVPGFIIVKKTSGVDDWSCYHTSLGATKFIVLNTTAAAGTNSTKWNNTEPTSTVFTVGTNASTNQSGATYVAYLFAHNAGGFGLTGTDNVISCGSYTGTGAAGLNVTLGYEPQLVLIKNASVGGAGYDWYMIDTMRGWSNTTATSYRRLQPNSSAAEDDGGAIIAPTATGFTFLDWTAGLNQSGNTYIYVAIRRGPMKVPTSGTSVYYTDTSRSAVSGSTPSWGSGFVTDMAFGKIVGNVANMNIASRLTGTGQLFTNTTSVEGTDATYTWDFMQGWGSAGSASSTFASWMFKRAPSFFDEVCYTGDGVNGRDIPHNLGTLPGVIFCKRRDSASNWTAYMEVPGTGYFLTLNSTSSAGASNYANGTLVPNTLTSLYAFNPGGSSLTSVNASGATYVAYLFATCAGVSKVGSYTGTGATQTISCGFTGGARFVLIKRTDSTGDWYVWDTARGMVSGTDPSLLLNSTAAEVNANSIYTTTGGFQIVSTAAGINASGGNYIYLAIA